MKVIEGSFFSDAFNFTPTQEHVFVATLSEHFFVWTSLSTCVVFLFVSMQPEHFFLSSQVHAFLQFKLRKVEKTTKRQEEEIAELRKERDEILRGGVKDFETYEKECKEKLRLGREKERKRRHSLEKIQKEERE